MMQKTIVYWLIGGVAILALWFFVFGNVSQITNYPPREGGIVAFGDSLVSGVGATEDHDFVSLLAGMIGEPIENLGVPGDTTSLGLVRLDKVIERHPRIVILLLGGNDYLRQIPQEQTFQHLETMISRFQEDGTLVVLLGVRGGIILDHFDEEFESLAERMGAAYVPDVLDGLFGNAKFMSDGIHPNDKGHRLIAEKIYPALSKVLR